MNMREIMNIVRDFKNLLILAAVFAGMAAACWLGGCAHATPSPSQAGCTEACANLVVLGCSEGTDPTCATTCQEAQDSGKLDLRPACLAAAKSVGEVLACGTVVCVARPADRP
jgi:hypothetical protein